mmetsp:Transcript_80509/g.211383  ORF Transcript_80509/g.211383 Transcript_80509/m.211383 type:complete len:455 (-) Transcript_80509:44-1408(-)
MESNQLFLLVNPLSGGQQGAKILAKVPRPFAVRAGDGREVYLHCFSMAEGAPFKKPGFLELRRCVSQFGTTRVIVAGGDGTIKWFVEEARKHGLDPEQQLLIGILPLGTGNDFSRALGWGGSWPRKLLNNGCEQLAAYVRKYLAASAQLHDVWQVVLAVDEEYGEIHYVNGSQQKMLKGSHVVTQTMINYFSMGLDGRSGYGFDKRRSKSRLCNVLVYMWEGFKKSLPCRPQQRIADFLDGLYHGTSREGDVIFHTSEEFEAPRPSRDAQLLVVQNISSYGGGTATLWHGASRLGVDRPIDANLLRAVDDPGDGKLEVVTVRNLATMVLDPIAQKLRGFGARRVFSGAPLFFKFVEDEEDEVVAFCQVDGEYLKLVNPVSATITFQGRLRVLSNLFADSPGYDREGYETSSETDEEREDAVDVEKHGHGEQKKLIVSPAAPLGPCSPLMGNAKS